MAETVGASITIAILSGQHLVWHGLQTILERNPSFHVVGKPTHCLSSPPLLAECRPDVIILDMETERDALKSLKQLRESAPGSKVLLLSGFEDKDPVREALEYGVDGVILKIHPPGVILAAVDALFSPHSLVPTGESRVMSAIPQPSLPAQSVPELLKTAWPDALTEREREVIKLVRQGLSNKDIAYQLSISDSTVRHHLTSIFDKVGVPNRQKLLVHAHHLADSVSSPT